MNEQEQRFLGLMEQHRQIIYKVCFMYASDDETISDLYQEVTLNLCFGGRLPTGGTHGRLSAPVALTSQRDERPAEPTSHPG